MMLMGIEGIVCDRSKAHAGNALQSGPLLRKIGYDSPNSRPGIFCSKSTR